MSTNTIPELDFRLEIIVLPNEVENLTDFNTIYHVLSTHSGQFTTVNLPPPTNGKGQLIIIKKEDLNISRILKIVSSQDSSITIDGNPQIHITTPRGVVGLYTDGNNYFTFTPRSGYYSSGAPLIIKGIAGNNPTKNTNVVIDSVRYRTLRQDDSFEIAIDFIQKAGGNGGSGDYLFSLPADLEFDPTVYTFYIDNPSASGQQPSIEMLNTISKIENMQCFASIFSNTSSMGLITTPVLIIPYNKTQFRAFQTIYGNFVGSTFGSLSSPVAYSFKFNIYYSSV
jgi:hypothetical protein